MAARLALLFLALALSPDDAWSQQSLAHTPPARFVSWSPASPAVHQAVLLRDDPTSRDRGRHALLGGVIGVAVGIVACTAISTLVDDDGDDGISTCPLDTYLIMGAAGFALGFAVGWAV